MTLVSAKYGQIEVELATALPELTHSLGGYNFGATFSELWSQDIFVCLCAVFSLWYFRIFRNYTMALE